MEIRENDKVCIITPLCANLDKYKLVQIFREIENESRRIALDLSEVSECSIDFIEGIKSIKSKKLSIFNISSDLFVLFNLMNLDKVVKVFASELDFEENARQIINRRFFCCS